MDSATLRATGPGIRPDASSGMLWENGHIAWICLVADLEEGDT